jgi:hypothetical protein
LSPGRPWLAFAEWLMFCAACKDDRVTEWESVFVKGSAVIRFGGIKYHEVSEKHKRAVDNKILKATRAHASLAVKSRPRLNCNKNKK